MAEVPELKLKDGTEVIVDDSKKSIPMDSASLMYYHQQTMNFVSNIKEDSDVPADATLIADIIFVGIFDDTAMLKLTWKIDPKTLLPAGKELTHNLDSLLEYPVGSSIQLMDYIMDSMFNEVRKHLNVNMGQIDNHLYMWS
jgi:hypothetical protein